MNDAMQQNYSYRIPSSHVINDYKFAASARMTNHGDVVRAVVLIQSDAVETKSTPFTPLTKVEDI